jgi:hypothetical protein
MSKVTRDGINRTLKTDADSGGTSVDAEAEATPAPRKRLDLNATITLSEDALAALLAEVKAGRVPEELEEDNVPLAGPGTVIPAATFPPVAKAAERVPAQPMVPQLWKRIEGGSKR